MAVALTAGSPLVGFSTEFVGEQSTRMRHAHGAHAMQCDANAWPPWAYGPMGPITQTGTSCTYMSTCSPERREKKVKYQTYVLASCRHSQPSSAASPPETQRLFFLFFFPSFFLEARVCSRVHFFFLRNLTYLSLSVNGRRNGQSNRPAVSDDLSYWTTPDKAWGPM